MIPVIDLEQVFRESTAVYNSNPNTGEAEAGESVHAEDQVDVSRFQECSMSWRGLVSNVFAGQRQRQGPGFDPQHPCNSWRSGKLLALKGRWIIRACWPDAITKSVRSMSGERPCLKNYGGEQPRKISDVISLIPVNMLTHMHLAHKHTHTVIDDTYLSVANIIGCSEKNVETVPIWH